MSKFKQTQRKALLSEIRAMYNKIWHSGKCRQLMTCQPELLELLWQAKDCIHQSKILSIKELNELKVEFNKVFKEYLL
jgi:hypothetical protein